jgi:membrane protein implicated in regulation of membrane protease activity
MQNLMVGAVVLAENAWWLILLFFAVIVVKVITDVRKAMRLSEKQWQQVDKSKLQTWDDDEQ